MDRVKDGDSRLAHTGTFPTGAVIKTFMFKNAENTNLLVGIFSKRLGTDFTKAKSYHGSNLSGH